MNLSQVGNEHVAIGFNSRRERRLIGREVFKSYQPSPAERCKSIVKALWSGNPNQFSDIRVPLEALPSVRDSAEQHGMALMSEVTEGKLRVAPELVLMSHAVAKMNEFILKSSIPSQIIS
ncbi:hypothetical protein BH10PAT3_BH10PAT3_4940 [soil metagenome]